MACPLFLPTSSRGDFYGGDCAAQPAALIPIETLRRCCNTGYARSACGHAAQSDPDAFQFLIKSHRDGVVGVAWSIERNHHPVAVGTLLIDGGACAIESNNPLERQARACAAAFFRQNGF